MISIFAGFLFFYSDGIQKTGGNEERENNTVKLENIHHNCSDCKELGKQDVENPDYVPGQCGNCANGKVDFWHQEILGDKECYFGKNIKKQN